MEKFSANIEGRGLLNGNPPHHQANNDLAEPRQLRVVVFQVLVVVGGVSDTLEMKAETVT